MKKTNAYDIVNARILGELEAGRIPWVNRAWTGSPFCAYNSVSKKPYSFVNQLLLTHDGESPIEQAEKCLGEYRDREGIKLAHEFTGSAYYSPESDGITLPLREQFKSPELYYSVSAHEHVHSTARRVNRTFNYKVGRERALEECVAQLGSAYLMNTWGIANPTTDDRDVNYIDSWISVIKDNPHAFVTAASRAEKAVKCILGTE